MLNSQQFRENLSRIPRYRQAASIPRYYFRLIKDTSVSSSSAHIMQGIHAVVQFLADHGELASALRYCATVLAVCFFSPAYIHIFIHLRSRLRRCICVAADPTSIDIIIDSGTTQHICHVRSRLKNYRRYWVPPMVEGADGTKFVAGHGDMEVSFVQRDGTTRVETIYGVQHLPNFTDTLFSTERLKASGIYYSTERQILYRRCPETGKKIEVAAVETDGDHPVLKMPIQELKIGSSATTSCWSSTAWAWVKIMARGYATSKPPATEPSGVSENEIDDLVETVAEQKQEIAALRWLLKLAPME